LPIHESELRLHDARRSLPNFMSASTPSKSILRIDDDLITGSLRQVLLSVSCEFDVAIGYDIAPDFYRTPALAKSAAGRRRWLP